MLACLRSAQFTYPDDGGSILVELPRHHDTSARCDNKEFLVSRRMTRLPGVMITKSFGAYPEAVRHWDLHVAVLTDQGLVRRDAKIVGFHEEG